MERMNINEIKEFAVVKVFGKECLYTIRRIDHNSIPKGVFIYEVREIEGRRDIATALERNVSANFMGTLLSKSLMLEGNTNCREFFMIQSVNGKKYPDPEEWKYEDNVMTLAQFLEPDADNHNKRHIPICSNGIERTYPTTVGRYFPESNGLEEQIIRAPYGQGCIYKNWEAFATDPSAVCYIPELSDETYSQNDFVNMCGGNKSLAEELFSSVDWQQPETLLDEWIRDGEVTECKKCGQFFNCYDELVCPNCWTTIH